MEPSPQLRRIEETVDDLGALDASPDEPFRELDPNVRFLWFFGRLIMWGFLLGMLLMARLIGLWGGNAAITMGVLSGAGLLSILHLFWPFISYRYWGYALRQHDLLIRSGVIWKRISAVPFTRIQHVDSGAGPLERTLGLANLVIHTAGAGMGSLSIPGVDADDAEELRDYLSEVGHTHANL